MPDYQKMYHILFNEVSQVIEALEQAQCETEEMYIGSQGPKFSAGEREAIETPK
jgi:hypothetical protein